MIAVAAVGLRIACTAAARGRRAVLTLTLAVIVLRLGQAVVGLLDADPVPRLGLGRKPEARVAQEAVGDELGCLLPAAGIALAPAGVVLQRAGQHHARDRGLDEVRAGVRHPLRRVADLVAVARQRLAGGVGADRQPEREAAEEGLVAQEPGHAVADPAGRFLARAAGHHAASRWAWAPSPKYPANCCASASASRFTWHRTLGSKLDEGRSVSGSALAILSFTS